MNTADARWQRINELFHAALRREPAEREAYVTEASNGDAEVRETAHEQGIIHRDLKPANIKLTRDGVVKVLDFGLAKLAEGGEAGRAGGAGRDALSLSPTITSPALMTGVGVLLGTAAYMAPEQAKGRPADKRSDIWAFGCVLFEMLTGTRAFDGEDIVDVLGAVARLDPNWGALPPMSA